MHKTTYRRIAALGGQILFLITIAFLLFCLAGSADYNHDEEQYVFAGLLATGMMPYADFVHLQMPFYPMTLGLLFSVIDGHYFEAARLLTFAFSVGSCLVVWLLARRLAASRAVAAAVTLLFATSSIMLAAFGSARNDSMPCFCALLGVLLVVEARRRAGGRAALHALAGLALAIAVGAKISYAFAPAAVFAYVLVCRRRATWRDHLRSDVLPLAAGGGLGALALLALALPAWDAFLYQVLEYHLSATPHWYRQNLLEHRLSWRGQVSDVLRYLFADTTLVAMVALVAIVLWQASRRALPSLLRNLLRHDGALVVLLMVAALPCVLAPRPTYIQYFQPLVPYLLLTVAALHGAAERAAAPARLAMLLAMAGVASLPGLGRLLIAVRQPSVVDQVHDVAQEVRRALASAEVAGKVATLSPIWVIDAGTEVYPEFAAGPFLFRTGDLLSPEQLRQWHAVSPATLPELLEAEPPAAILTGFESDFSAVADAPLEAYAQRCGYRQVAGDFGPGRLFVRGADSCARRAATSAGGGR